jgi:hypothetical protein
MQYSTKLKLSQGTLIWGASANGLLSYSDRLPLSIDCQDTVVDALIGAPHLRKWLSVGHLWNLTYESENEDGEGPH